METERFHLIKEIFQSALERRPEEREAFLAAACAGDDELRLDVKTLLAQQTDTFLETPAIEVHAGLFAREDHSEENVQLKAGDSISHYRIVSLLGRGGMGEVYLAEDARFERKVAIKLLRGQWTNDPERVRRFEQEARAASALNHPNIITVHDIGQDGSIRFITTEFVDGQTLRQILKSRRMSAREALDVGAQVAAALVAAHEAGIVHRDIKPENVMVRRDGYVKVLDFGIAKRASPRDPADSNERITATGVVIGTAGYMSPEQARGQELDARTDVFSLGVLIYEMVAGQPPFGGETQADVIAEILTKAPSPLAQATPEMPVELGQLVARALRKRPEERHQTSGELLAELKTLKENLELREKIKQSPAPSSAPDVEGGSKTLPPLLSEFDFSPRLRLLLRRNPHGGSLALAAAAGGLAAILLSWVVGAACIRVTFTSQPCPAQSQTLTFGYLAELNAGLLYLVGFPVVIIAAFHLINLSQVMLRRLVSGERLIIVGRKQAEAGLTPLEIIGRRNRRLYHRLIPFFALFAMALVCVGEYRDRDKLAFGWVQALSVKDMEGKDLARIRREKNVEDLPALANLEPQCVIHVSQVKGGHGSGDRAKWRTPFLIFVTVAFGLQIAFIAFGLWISTKIIFLFVTLSYALLDRPRQTFKIILDFEDEKKRFGLAALDIVHNAILTIVLVASVIVILQQVANVVKGTSVFSGAAGWSLTGQALLFLLSLFGLIMLLVLPVLIFVRLIETAVGRHLERFDGEEAEFRKILAGEIPATPGRNPEVALKALQAKRELAAQQRPWPRENSIYRWLMLMNIILLLVLLSYKYPSVFGNKVFSNLARGLSEWLCDFTQLGYH